MSAPTGRPSGSRSKSPDSDDPETYVEARLKGPNHEKILAQSKIIAADFQAAVDRLTRKKKERPDVPISVLYYEEPFKSEAVHVQQRLMEEDQETLRGQSIPNDFDVKGVGIPIITMSDEARLNANIQRKKEREMNRKRKSAAWNPDQNTHTEGTGFSKVAPSSPEEEPKSGCTACKGPCALDSRRSIMTCTNEPMLPELMADLLGQFYRLGWMTGSGGAMAAISCDNRLLLSPSSLQKERIKPCDLFASPPNSLIVRAPVCCPNGKPTACQGIFKKIMSATGAQCVIHSHSKASNLATRIIRTPEWAISGQEFIKGIYNYKTGKNMDNEDILIVPIIENMPQEEDLEPQVEAVLANPQYKACTAILVRNHGVFVWGPTWQKAKIMTEVYDYLFELSLDVMKMGLPLVRQEDVARALRNGVIAPPTPEVAAALQQHIQQYQAQQAQQAAAAAAAAAPSAPPPE